MAEYRLLGEFVIKKLRYHNLLLVSGYDSLRSRHKLCDVVSQKLQPRLPIWRMLHRDPVDAIYKTIS